MNNNSVTIRISRNKNVADNRSIAIIKLNKLVHKVGQPVMVKYFSDLSKTTIDTVVAIGVKEGIGKDCYKIISLGGLIPINGVNIETPLDASELNEQELFLYKKDGYWYFVYLEESTKPNEWVKVEEKIVDLSPTVFVNIKDNFRWFWRDGVLKREDDFLSSGTESEFIEDLTYSITPKFTATIKGWYNKVTNEYEKPPYLSKKPLDKVIIVVNILNSAGINITESFNFFIENKQCELKKDPIDNNYYIELINLSETKIFKLDAKITSISGLTYTYTNYIEITFGDYCYYGYDYFEEFNNSQEWTGKIGYKFLNKKSTYFKKLISYDSDIVLDDIKLDRPGKIFIAYPVNKLIHIYDNHGLDYLLNDYERFLINLHSDITNESTKYYLYILKNPIEVENFRQQFISNEYTTTEYGGLSINQSSLFDKELENAWKNKNSANGLVQLDSEGKLDDNFLPDDLSSLGSSIDSEKIDNIINIL